MPDSELSLRRDAFGRLQLDTAAGAREVVVVRAFPLAAPGEGIALLGTDGHELAWVERLAGLPGDVRALLEAELASREFVPEISCIHSVSSFATPSTWQVATDRGESVLVLKGEEDIRRLPGGALLIADASGIHFRIRAPLDLDRNSRRLLDRFL
jgi:hypothetical protein